jgi:hypothetical protein
MRKKILILMFSGLGICSAFTAAQERATEESEGRSVYPGAPIESQASSTNEDARISIGPTPSYARRNNSRGTPSPFDEPGRKRLAGLNAPESEAIKFLLLDVERYRDDVGVSDFQKLEDAELSITNKNYLTGQVTESCRYLLSLNGDYESKEAVAKKIAEELTALDEAESEHVKIAFYNLVDSLSPQAQQLMLSEKAEIHAHIRSNIEDYFYTSVSNPDFLIERRVAFCSRI